MPDLQEGDKVLVRGVSLGPHGEPDKWSLRNGQEGVVVRPVNGYVSGFRSVRFEDGETLAFFVHELVRLDD